MALDFEFDEFCDKVGQIDNRGASTYAVGDPAGSEDRIKDVTYYIFDSKGICVSRQFEEDFTGSSKISLIGKDAFTVYAIVNCRELIEFPAADGMTVSRLEEMTVPHQETYDYLPFTGKVTIDLVSDPSIKTVKIKLTRVNSAIRVVNDSADRIDITNTSVSNLPSEGYLFKEGVPAGVEYSATGKPSNADGDIFSFYIPQSQMGKLSFDIEAVTLDENKEVSISSPIKFSEELATGDRATAMVGYLESGTLKVGSPDNWGNVGKYELPGGVQLQVVGGEFFDYKSVKGLRASSGGGEFSFIVKATEGVASLSVVGSVDWVTVRDNVIVVSQNTGSSERECQIAIAVGGKNIGVFYIVQGKGITFSCASLSIVNNRLEKIGGTGSSSALYTVTFDISDDELAATEIAPEGNGENGITVEVNRSAKTVSVHFMALVDASQVGAEGVSVPVRFLDVNGTEQACLEVVQRPAKITFNPVRYKNISYQGGTVTASVTVEGDAKWNVNGILDKGGKPVDAWLTGPATGEQFDSGSNLVLTAAPNGTSAGRTAYVTVKSRYTLSKPYEITQAPSYGVKNISSDVGWDDESATLKAYSKGRTYTFSFDTEIAIPEHIKLAVECGSESDITASEITNTSGNSYTFTLTVPDSDNTEEEVTSVTDITADGTPIGSFTVLRAYKPQFISMETSVWGGVKDRPQLKNVTYRASEWDLKDFVSSNGNLPVSRSTDEIAVVSYAETLTHDAQAQTATITMNLNGGNSVSYTTTQAPVAFTISDADLAKLENVVKEGGDIGGITVTTQAGSVGTPWRVASASDTWLTTDPAIDGTETNASGSTLTVKFAANDTGDRTGSFVLESRNTTSPAYEVSQRGTFGVTVSGVTYNGKSALFADGMLKAFSAKYDYTFNITTDNAITGSRLNITGKTTGSAVTVKTQPSGTDLKTSHSFVISVPASTLTTEPESVFDIMVDGNRIGGFTVKQAKKPSISVKTSTTVGGSSSAVSGSFVASTWDLKSTNYVTSSSSTLTIANPSTAGTFSVNMKPSFLQTDDNLTATITLVGVNGNLGTCSIAQSKVVYVFSPTSLKFEFDETSAGKTVTVTSSNAGTISSGMTATSSQTWCTVTVAGNVVTAKVTENTGNTSRTATVYVTYRNSRSQTFDVVQDSDGPATITIGGLQWTLYNLANPAQASGGATFATKLPSQCTGNRSESHGRFYQWNRNVSWNTIESSASGANPSDSTWQTTNPSVTSWTTNPCPSGFVVPTKAQWDALIAACNATNGGGWSSSDYGYKILTDKTNSANKLEFSVVGRRDYSSGALEVAGTYGYYWSSVQYDSISAYRMSFSSSGMNTSNNDRRYGFSVRCVRQ